ncbi:MAG: hypothetical protein J5879_00240, partial [Clostridia bacterium]|nr:hypothetical protein [Clostridia bacterium]
MKTNEKTVADLIERKRKYDEKRAARKRIAAITAAALAVIIVVASVPVFALAAANRKTPAVPVVTDGSTDGVAATEETSETAPDTEEQTGAVPDTEEQTKRAEEKTGDDQANKHTGEWEYGLKVDFYEKDKKDPLILSKEEYGRSKWMSKDMIKQYHIDMPVDHLQDDYDFSDYEEDFYGYAKKPDGIYELEISLKNSENWVGAEYLL